MYRPIVINDNNGNILAGFLHTNTGIFNANGFELARCTIFDHILATTIYRDIPAVPFPSGPQDEGYSWRELSQNERDEYLKSLSRVQAPFPGTGAKGITQF